MLSSSSSVDNGRDGAFRWRAAVRGGERAPSGPGVEGQPAATSSGGGKGPDDEGVGECGRGGMRSLRGGVGDGGVNVVGTPIVSGAGSAGRCGGGVAGGGSCVVSRVLYGGTDGNGGPIAVEGDAGGGGSLVRNVGAAGVGECVRRSGGGDISATKRSSSAEAVMTRRRRFPSRRSSMRSTIGRAFFRSVWSSSSNDERVVLCVSSKCASTSEAMVDLNWSAAIRRRSRSTVEGDGTLMPSTRWLMFRPIDGGQSCQFARWCVTWA